MLNVAGRDPGIHIAILRHYSVCTWKMFITDQLMNRLKDYMDVMNNIF